LHDAAKARLRVGSGLRTRHGGEQVQQPGLACVVRPHGGQIGQQPVLSGQRRPDIVQQSQLLGRIVTGRQVLHALAQYTAHRQCLPQRQRRLGHQLQAQVMQLLRSLLRGVRLRRQRLMQHVGPQRALQFGKRHGVRAGQCQTGGFRTR